MKTEVIRDRCGLTIRWTDGNDEWRVAKRFNLSTRILQSATVHGPAKTRFNSAAEARQFERVLHYAAYLAETMDSIFLNPVDFDRMTIDDRPPLGGYPAAIFSRDDGRIYIQTGNS